MILQPAGREFHGEDRRNKAKQVDTKPWSQYPDCNDISAIKDYK